MPYSQRKSSVSRDFILLFAVIMVTIAIVALWVAYKTFENYADGVIAEMEGEAIRIDRSLIVEIKSASYLLESLARQVVQIGSGDHQKIARLLRSFNDNSQRNDEFAWMNAEQNVIINSGSGILPKPVNLSDRDYVKKSLAAPWQVHLGRPVKGRVTERWILPLSLGVTDYQGVFVGMIVLNLDIEQLTKELAQITRESGMEFSIYMKTLNLIANSRIDYTAFEYVDSGRSSLAEIDFDTSRKGLLSKPQLFQPSRPFIYYEASTQYPYIVEITYNQIKSDDKIFALMQARLSQILIVSVFLLTLLWMVRTRIIRPVEQLSDMTAAICAGERYKPLPKGGPIEIENLANQIRRLSDYLNEQHRIEQELKLKNQFLTKLQENSSTLTKARNGFLAQMASEIQRPIHYALEYVQNIRHERHGTISPQEYASDAVEVSGHLMRLQNMAEDLYEIGEMESHIMTLRESSTNISFVLHRALRKFHAFQQYQHVEVKLKIHDNLPNLLIDEERFIQILVHLLCGAVASLMQGTQIDMVAQCESDEKGARVLVIQLNYLTHIHLPVQENAPTTSSTESTDLSPRIKSDTTCFALARMLISLYDGEMSAGTAKGEMNRIFIRFPEHRLLD